jgi:hypothetical protein
MLICIRYRYNRKTKLTERYFWGGDSNSAFKGYKTVFSLTPSQLLVGKNTDVVAA